MPTLKNITLTLLGLTLSFAVFANDDRPIACKNFHNEELKISITAANPNFVWDDPNCKIVGTQSVFPKKGKNGKVQFRKGMQAFIYQDNQLKLICLPGWECKSW